MSKTVEFVKFSKMCVCSISDATLTDGEVEFLRKDYDSIGHDRIFELAQKKKMIPFVAKLMCTIEKDSDVWQPIYQRYIDRNALVLDELSNIHAAFQKEGIKKVFLSENFGALLAGDGDIGLFCSGDVDHFVDKKERTKIDAAFASLGYNKKERFAGELLISADYSHPTRLPDQFAIGVDYFPLSRLWLPCFINADDFCDWSHLRRYHDSAIAIPPADALMYICLLHISLHSFVRAPGIRLYRDVVNASNGMTEDHWRNIKTFTERDNTKRRVATAAFIASKMTGIIIPDFISSLAGCENKRLLSLVYDSDHNILNAEPSRINVKRIELLCNDFNKEHALAEILFPDRAWMREVYGTVGIAAHLKHISQLF